MATRVALVVGGLLADAWRAGYGRPRPPAAPTPPPSATPTLPPLRPALRDQPAAVAEVIAPGVPAALIARGLIAWTQLFGMISFELLGQLVGSVDPADEFFGFAVEQMADFVGLP